MAILSIQSHVSYGHVGNSAAVFPLQRAGHEVWPIHTVNFSNHTEYPDWGGPVFAESVVRDIVDGVARRGVLPQVDAVLTGYLGSPALADVVVETVARVRAANPRALFACDPVIGNAIFGDFVAPEIPAVFRDKVVPLADVITPNQYEVGVLTGLARRDLPGTIAGARQLLALGPKVCLVTSVQHPDMPPGTIEMLAVTVDAAWQVATPLIAGSSLAGGKVVGAGDITAALFTGHLLDGCAPRVALERTATAVFGLIESTRSAGLDELDVVGNQELFAPGKTPDFRARAVS